jgi:hypothetical protein
MWPYRTPGQLCFGQSRAKTEKYYLSNNNFPRLDIEMDMPGASQRGPRRGVTKSMPQAINTS